MEFIERSETVVIKKISIWLSRLAFFELTIITFSIKTTLFKKVKHV